MSPAAFNSPVIDPRPATLQALAKPGHGPTRPPVAGIMSVLMMALNGCAGGGDASSCEQTSECDVAETCVAGHCEGSDPSGGEGAGGDMTLPPMGGSTGGGGSDESCGEVTFEMTKTQEVFLVPEAVSYMHVKAWGAGANGEGQCAYDDGGLGGFTEGVFQVVPGTELIVIVGERGRAGMTGTEIVKFGFGDFEEGNLHPLWYLPSTALTGVASIFPSPYASRRSSASAAQSASIF
jgi:hypothetical protein